ncbi:helix-turn-helix domain-containing protein [Pseudonocardia oroxyli]|uniref:helix-turn-helix domain-containing protein n=1 Tax=Pseudonocardia oroxyli TaxID=366584 RepID=UPI003CCBD87A
MDNLPNRDDPRWTLLSQFVTDSSDLGRVTPRKRAEILSLLGDISAWRAGFAASGSGVGPRPAAQHTVLSVAEVAALIGRSERRVRQLAKELGGERHGRDWTFPREGVDAYLRVRRKR